ncbi:sensor histidine kinase [Sphingobacterium athyrii]|uniref:Signal transduction histidine kinase internal region domain-containing protein n=1 Tax=Sphingobacterium athyrii TaxID=2152717 RepID=A0A363NUM5_9SPHI|nr:histidine kinase [Sphingobacterium athyrii]PUV24484.1 hypothetical protein DCO56_14160 [Sphingobacterium athyrii]
MNSKPNTKKIALLNCLVAVVAGVVVLLFQVSGDYSNFRLYLPLMGVIIVFAVSMMDLQILKKIRSNPNRRHGWYLLSYLSSAATYLICWPPFSIMLKIKWKYDNFNLLFTLVLSSIILNTAILLIQHFLLLQQEKARAEVEVSLLKVANVEASNLLLRQQIQPHFLFNSLSNLKALYKEDPQAGESYIVHLANFLRISVSNQNKKIAMLTEEIDFLHDYLEMQKIRFGRAILFEIIVPQSSLYQYYLPTFSLQLLAENAIKHNELTNESPLRIRICSEGNRITVLNSVRKKQHPEVSTGLGLANLSERHQLLSGNTIEIKQTEDEFTVTLTLLTNENINN